jgi:sporulation protein YlmC with PRC-barrel domain
MGRLDGSALEKTDIAGDPGGIPEGKRVMRITPMEQMKGKTVLDDTGRVVGTLDDILIDSESLDVTGFRLRLKREVAKDIGAESRLFQGAVLELPRDIVRGAADAVILSVPLARLRELAAPGAPAQPAADPGVQEPAARE